MTAGNHRITRTLLLPDPVRLARYQRAPDLGPRILFFSGGTAIRTLSQKLIQYTHNSIHIITPFDSGGSSAVLRDKFQMLSVGDIRNRLMALADQSIHGNPAIYDLFACRLQKDEAQERLQKELEEMIAGRHSLVRAIPSPMRKIIRNHLDYFWRQTEQQFDLRGASIGNLILTGGYLNNGKHIDPVIYIFTKLVEARGIVRPVANANLHMVARLTDGTTIIGQHNITGKEQKPLHLPVEELYLTDTKGTTEEIANETANETAKQTAKQTEPPEKKTISIRKKVQKLMAPAELIVYPMGSLYSSIIANFLVDGVGEEVAKNDCPKIYIPTTGHDPERVGLSLADTVERIIWYLRRSAGREIETTQLMNFVIIDPRASYQNTPQSELDNEMKRIREMGIDVIESDLLSSATAQKNKDVYLSDERLISTILSFV